MFNDVMRQWRCETYYSTLFSTNVGSGSLFCLKLPALASAEDCHLPRWRLFPR